MTPLYSSVLENSTSPLASASDPFIPITSFCDPLSVDPLFVSANSVDYVAAGKDVAMQIAAMNPIALDKDGVDHSVVEKEIEIGKEQALKEGKPENIIEKIAQGKLQKFFKDNTLLSQPFVGGMRNAIQRPFFLVAFCGQTSVSQKGPKSQIEARFESS